MDWQRRVLPSAIHPQHDFAAGFSTLEPAARLQQAATVSSRT
jgi:hypothetical protein